MRFDHLNTYNLDIRDIGYADTQLDSLRDRDNPPMFFGYQF